MTASKDDSDLVGKYLIVPRKKGVLEKRNRQEDKKTAKKQQKRQTVDSTNQMTMLIPARVVAYRPFHLRSLTSLVGLSPRISEHKSDTLPQFSKF